MQRRIVDLRRAVLPTAFAVCFASLAGAQEWSVYGGDPGGMKYSALNRITRENVTHLTPAWIFHTGDFSDGSKSPTRSAFESTPLVVDGVMYVTTPFSRVIALDAETGREIWSFDPRMDRTEPAMLYSSRGAAYWTNGKQRRIMFGTLDGRLFSLIAESGKPDDSFGVGGWVNLRKGVADDFPGMRVGMSSPPVVYRNLVICGSIVPDGEPHGPAGDVRAFDAVSGKLVWTFHTVPRKGEFGYETWAVGSPEKRGGANAWSIPSLDAARGILYLPLTSPSTDFSGGDRKGAGLFGDSLVALDAASGKRLWHFQTVHHNLWDYDLPAQPMLVQVRKNGKLVDAVAQVTKTGFTFVFDRVTGEPVFPIKEVPVAKSETPGEEAWPTQPRPVKPPPYARQGMTADELTNVTPESRSFCGKLVEGAVFGRLFTPVGLQPTVLFPGTNGGANWGGGSYDPATHTLYVNSMDVGMIDRMVKRPEGSEVPYRVQGLGTANSRFWDTDLNPCQKPPWGQLTAIDLDKGEFRWQSVLGVVDDLIARGVPPTGAPNMGGSLTTAGGLVFIGATNDSRFRAFDKETGKELWVTRLPASAHATPMTFRGRRTGRQFVVIAAGGGNKYNKTYSDSLVAFALPEGAGNVEPLVSYSKAIAREAERSAASVPMAAAVAQPFDHKAHAALKLECSRCHPVAERAGFPAVAVCVDCHQSRPEPLPAAGNITTAGPLNRLPGFVFFRHDRHASKGVACATCHGDMWAQSSIRPALQMKMASCIECHQANRAAVTCTTCHELSQ